MAKPKAITLSYKRRIENFYRRERKKIINFPKFFERIWGNLKSVNESFDQRKR